MYKEEVLVHTFSYLFSESNLEVHNCTKCRQCLPKVFQQERAPSDGETQSKDLWAVPCVDALNLLREPSVLDGSKVEARRSGCTTGHASTPKGLIGDRENQRPCAGATARDYRCCGRSSEKRLPWRSCVGPTRLISDRKASDLAPSLSSATGSANCGLHVMVKQARV